MIATVDKTTQERTVFVDGVDRVSCGVVYKGTAAFDVQAVCTGFIYALGIADKFIRTGSSRCALVVGAETLSRIVDWNDRSTSILFGDGAGAVVLEASDEPGILSTHLHAAGTVSRCS